MFHCSFAWVVCLFYLFVVVVVLLFFVVVLFVCLLLLLGWGGGILCQSWSNLYHSSCPHKHVLIRSVGVFGVSFERLHSVCFVVPCQQYSTFVSCSQNATWEQNHLHQQCDFLRDFKAETAVSVLFCPFSVNTSMLVTSLFYVYLFLSARPPLPFFFFFFLKGGGGGISINKRK